MTMICMNRRECLINKIFLCDIIGDVKKSQAFGFVGMIGLW